MLLDILIFFIPRREYTSGPSLHITWEMRSGPALASVIRVNAFPTEPAPSVASSCTALGRSIPLSGGQQTVLFSGLLQALCLPGWNGVEIMYHRQGRFLRTAYSEQIGRVIP